MDMQYMKMQILEVGLLILAAYIGGLLARKLKIGEIVGQILGGMLVGPHFWEWVRRQFFSGDFFATHPGFWWVQNFYQNGGYQRYTQIFESYNFITFLFLGVIAFSLGEELHHSRLRQVGIKATIICIFQGLVTFFFIALGIKLLFGQTFTWIDAFIIGSIGIATAPAITFIIMNKFKIEGPLKNILANIVVLDDIMEVVIFSIFLAIAQSQLIIGSHLSPLTLAWKISREMGIAILIAIGIFFILKLAFIRREHNLEEETHSAKTPEDKTFLSTMLFNHPTPSVEILLIIIGVVAVGIAFAIHLEAPFLITAVIAGYLIANYHHSAFFDSLKIDNVMTIFNLLFFGMIGVSIHVESFNRETLLFSLAYFVLRASGKLIGNWTGAKITKQDPKIVATLPKLMLPQAGMAAVEIVLVATVLKQGNGMLIFNTILPALVLFELGGAYITEKTLERWKDYTVGEQEAFTQADAEKGKLLDIDELLANRVYELNLDNKEAILYKIIDNAVKQNILTDREQIFRAVTARDELGHVSTRGGLALPHCRITGLKHPYLLCAILNNPLQWCPEDEYLVNYVFLILTPEDKPNMHINVLRTIAVFSKQVSFSRHLHDLADKSKI
jgi:Kef-type K+ transport system membrane component KefB